MYRYSKQYPAETYKPGGITKKIEFYTWMLDDRSNNVVDSDPLTRGDRLENLGDWKHGYYEFTSKPNNDPDVIKTILQSLIDLSKKQNPTDLYMYMDELKKIKITNPDINYLLDIFNAQRDTFESVYYDDAAENIDEAKSRAEAETEMFNEDMPSNNFKQQNNRKISKNYKSIIKLAAFYDQTQQYKKADKITNILNKFASDDWDDLKNATTGYTCPLCNGFLIDGKCPKCKNKNKEIVKTLTHDKEYNELKAEVNQGISEIISQVKRPKVKNPHVEVQRFRHFIKNYLFHFKDSERVYNSYKNYARNDEDGFFKTMLELCDYVDYFKERHNLEPRELNRMILK